MDEPSSLNSWTNSKFESTSGGDGERGQREEGEIQKFASEKGDEWKPVRENDWKEKEDR